MNRPLTSQDRARIAIAAFSLLMILCASASNAVMDALVSRYDQSVFASLPAQSQRWWDPRISYKNKWKDGERSKGEAFFLSSTTLVPVTDAWHFFKFVTIWCLYAAILAPFTRLVSLRWYVWVVIVLAIDIARGTLFELFYTKLLIR